MKITLSDNKTILDLNKNQLNPVIGFQAFHFFTGRLLPQCGYHEVYDKYAMLNKIGKLYNSRLITNPPEWVLVPFYQSEWSSDHILIEN